MKTIFISCFLFACIACQKTSKEPILPQIKFISPAPNAVFSGNSNFLIVVNVSHTSNLHDWQLALHLGSTDSVLMVRTGHKHAKEIQIEETFINNLGPINDSIKMYFNVKDHNNLEANYQQTIFLKP